MYHPTYAAHFGFVELSDVTVRTRDCKYKLTQHHCHYDLRIFSFTNCLITFRVRRSRGEIYIVTAICMFVCLSVPHPISTLLHRPDVTWENGTGCPLVVHYWADLQSVHGFCCYDNIAPNVKCDECLYLLYAWFLFGTVYQITWFLLKLLILTRAQQLLRLASVLPQ